MSGLFIGAAVVLVGGMAAALAAAFRGVEGRGAERLVSKREDPERAPVEPRPPDKTDPSPLLTTSLDRMGIRKRLQNELLQAGLLLRPSELVTLMLGTLCVGFTVGLFLHGAVVALALGLVGAGLPWVYIRGRKARRRKALVGQLAEALGMMASSLRSGYSFMRAIQVVTSEMDPPIAEEFGRVLDELNVGVSHERALKHLMDRCPSGDIELVVTACQIQATVGGNLAEILDTTAAMIRERVRLQGEIAALTAEGRLSAGILTALPVFMALVVSHLSPGYMNPLIDTRVGLMMLGGAGGAMLMGVLVIKKMLAIRI